jgi:hypothetical protein
MAALERGERLQIMLNEEELAAVENWRFEKRMPSRAAAVRELLRRGLAADGFMAAESGVKSQDFGIPSDQRAHHGSFGELLKRGAPQRPAGASAATLESR